MYNVNGQCKHTRQLFWVADLEPQWCPVNTRHDNHICQNWKRHSAQHLGKANEGEGQHHPLCVCVSLHADVHVCVSKKERLRDWAEREGGMSNTNNIPLPLLALPAALSHCLSLFSRLCLELTYSPHKRKDCMCFLSVQTAKTLNTLQFWSTCVKVFGVFF